MSARDKKQCPVRFHADTYDRIKEKLDRDGLSYQQLADLLFSEYIKHNKEIDRIVKRYLESKSEKRTNQFDPDEREEILRMIEKEHSPIKFMKKEVV